MPTQFFIYFWCVFSGTEKSIFSEIRHGRVFNYDNIIDYNSNKFKLLFETLLNDILNILCYGIFYNFDNNLEIYTHTHTHNYYTNRDNVKL